MNSAGLKEILGEVQSGRLSVNDALGRLKHFPYESLEFAHLDHHRTLRQGMGETVYCEGKTPGQVRLIMQKLAATGIPVLGTRASRKHYQAVLDSCPGAVFHETARAISIASYGKNGRKTPGRSGKNSVLIITAGTSDLPVGEEARVSLEFFGNPVSTLFDVGVAGLHRIMDHREKLDSAGVLIIAAGMDGALVSVAGGWTDKPVIAVPTSQGYGSSFEGLSALLAMLNSCAPGIAVMNIDNGFGAAVLAHRILNLTVSPEKMNPRRTGKQQTEFRRKEDL